MLALTPAQALVGVLIIIIAAIFGAVEAPANAVQIFGFCSVAMLALLNMLQQSKTQQKLEENTQLTAQVKQEAAKTKAEVKAALIASDLDKSHKLDEIKTAVETVVKQTNGPLTEKLEELKDKVEKVDNKLPPSSPAQ